MTDGLATALDWGRAGKELSPREWHGAVKADGEGRRPLMLDCRNLYESEVGSFEGAEPVGTLTFSETWDTLRSRPHTHGKCMAHAWHMHGTCTCTCMCMHIASHAHRSTRMCSSMCSSMCIAQHAQSIPTRVTVRGRLEGVPSDTPIMTYCTGGIRCVKVNAFLEQSLGFSNTMRLQDGINGYLRFLREEQADDSAWRGQNFVFDKRTLVEPPADSTTGDGGGLEGEDDA